MDEIGKLPKKAKCLFIKPFFSQTHNISLQFKKGLFLCKINKKIKNVSLPDSDCRDVDFHWNVMYNSH